MLIPPPATTRLYKRINDLAKMFRPIICGWINYYGWYHKSALSRALMHLDLRTQELGPLRVLAGCPAFEPPSKFASNSRLSSSSRFR
ncbi:group II intron maturase-specific domain-containing protein [Pseudaminobacter soli (ex Li et al. 2025)]|uniref:group II intron maturase-specific domain-containing protein n=1 Tax=Pseudaminobacter soli (ex Li et al. 2025) TaxID=1295366 RepID=UPI003CD04C5F